MSDTVPCADCGRDIPAARAAIVALHGLCAECNAPTLRCNTQSLAPEYETAVWARGGRLE